MYGTEVHDGNVWVEALANGARSGVKTATRWISGELRELLILEELERNSNISQRALGDRLGMAVGLVNRHLRGMIEAGYVQVVNREVKPFAYELTAEGKRYRRRVSLAHYRSVLGSFRDVQRRINGRLRELRRAGVKRVVFYGAGEVMEITYPLAKAAGLEVVGVVDDDPVKRGAMKDQLEIEGPGGIEELAPDAVVITTFRHAEEIQRRINPPLPSSILIWEL